MMSLTKKQKVTKWYKGVAAFVALAFGFNIVLPPGISYAQLIHPAATMPTALNLPVPGAMVPLSPGFTPPLVQGITVHPENPLQFDFFVSPGDDKIQGEALKKESQRLIKYFLASLTVPENELWVNLSPYEKDRIIPESFGQTEMGRDLLAQDYLLKQLSASMMYPEKKLGKKFWDRVYKKAYELYGTTEIPMSTFNKIWIVPEKAVVYQSGQSVFVVESKLKVMLEEDYLAREKYFKESETLSVKSEAFEAMRYASRNTNDDTEIISGVTSEVVREVLIPEIEKEVNQGKTFANLRQIFNSMILATWYKQNLKESLLGQIYVNQNKIKGVDVADKQVKEKIYSQYLAALKKGVYNYIKEDYDPVAQKKIPRKYFSGGIVGNFSLPHGVLTVVHTHELTKEYMDNLPDNLTTQIVVGLNEIPSALETESRSVPKSSTKVVLLSQMKGPRPIAYDDLVRQFLDEDAITRMDIVELKKLLDKANEDKALNPDKKPYSLRVLQDLPLGELAVYTNTSGEIEYILNERLARELLSVHRNNPDDPEIALGILTGLLRHARDLGEKSSIYDMYKQHYTKIKADYARFKLLIYNNENINVHFLSDYFVLLHTLDNDPEILALLDEIIEEVEALEAEVKEIYLNPEGKEIGDRDVVAVLREIYAGEDAVENLEDTTYLRNRRINRAYVKVDADYFGQNIGQPNPAQQLKSKPAIKGTFFDLYAQVLGHRATAQGRESFFYMAKDAVSVVRFSQTKNIYAASPKNFDGQYDDFEKRQYYAFHKGPLFSSGIGATEAENPEDSQQPWHVHETNQEFTTSLSDNTQLRYGHEATVEEKAIIGLIAEYKTTQDEREIDFGGERKFVTKIKVNGVFKYIVVDHEEMVPFGHMIAMPKGTFHTIRNTSPKQKSMDFTIKDPVTQLIKTFSPPEEINIDKPTIFSPEVVKRRWGKIYEHIYMTPYNMRMLTDKEGRMEYTFDEAGNPVPVMGDSLRMTLRIVEVKPGETTDKFSFQALEPHRDNLQIIRIFPWPRTLSEKTNNRENDWYLYRDYKNIRAEVTVTSEGEPEKMVEALGGDLVLLDNKKANDKIKSFQVKNTSKEHTLIFYVLEPADTTAIGHHLSQTELALLREDDEKKGFISARPYNPERVRNQLKNLRAQLPDRNDFPTDEEVISWVEESREINAEGKITYKNFHRDEVHVLARASRDARVIGRINRKIAEKFGFCHETANIVLMTPDGEVLVQLRNKDNYDDHLAVHGGHLGVGQSHVSGAEDETLEETGMKYLEFDPVFIGYESYDIEGDNNKERRSWFVKILTDREFKKNKDAIERLKKIKQKKTREKTKDYLFQWQKEHPGEGEVIGIYPMPFRKILNALTKAYKAINKDPKIFDGKYVRFLSVNDTFQGIEESIEAYFTPDALDRLLSDQELGKEMHEATGRIGWMVKTFVKSITDRDERDGLTEKKLKELENEPNTIVLHTDLGDKPDELARKAIQQLEAIKKKKGISNKGVAITIAGGSGAGKTTMAQTIAKQMKAKNISVGLVYRALAYQMIQQGIEKTPDAVAGALESQAGNILKDLAFSIDQDFNPSIEFQGKDILDELNENRIDIEKTLSGEVWGRHELHDKIKDFWLKQVENEVNNGRNIVADMRPQQADQIPESIERVSVYLTADISTRAGRRANDHIRQVGLNQAYKEVLYEIADQNITHIRQESTESRGDAEFFLKSKQTNPHEAMDLMAVMLDKDNEATEKFLSLVLDIVSQGKKIDKAGFILASQSPRRKDVLQKMLKDRQYQAVSPGIDEHVSPFSSYEAAMRAISVEKALTVAEGEKAGIVIASDTTMYLDGNVLGKLDNDIGLNDYLATIDKFSVHPVKVVSSAIINNVGESKVNIGHETAYITLRKQGEKLSEEEIALLRALVQEAEYSYLSEVAKQETILIRDILSAYWQSGRFKGKAGGFGVQDRDFFFAVKKMSGNPFVVVGMPTRILEEHLSKAGVELVEQFEQSARNSLWPSNIEKEKIDLLKEEFMDFIKSGRATFAMIKPDGVEFKDKIINDLEKAGFIVQPGPQMAFDGSTARKFYAVHDGKDFFERDLIPYILSGEVIPLFLQLGPDTEEKDITKLLRETQKKIREELSAGEVQNRFHGSDALESAEYEANVIFDYMARLSQKQDIPSSGAVSREEKPRTGSDDKFPHIGGKRDVYYAGPESLGSAKEKTAPLTVLVVDDDSTAREYIIETIHNVRENVTIVQVEDGMDALEIIENFSDQVDLVITDYRMKRMKGDALVMQLSESHPEIPVVLATAEPGKVRHLKGTAENLLEVMGKYGDSEFIEKKIADILEKAIAKKKAPGGIDLNPAHFELQIKRDSNGVPLPVHQQPIQNIHIDGFVPVIIHMAPVVNIPLLLGFDTNEKNDGVNKQASFPYERSPNYLNERRLWAVKEEREKVFNI